MQIKLRYCFKQKYAIVTITILTCLEYSKKRYILIEIIFMNCVLNFLSSLFFHCKNYINCLKGTGISNTGFIVIGFK